MTASKKEIYSEEYAACRQRISDEIGQINRNEYTSLFIIGSICYYVLENSSLYLEILIAWAIVILVCLAGNGRYEAHRKIIRILEKFQYEKFEKGSSIDDSMHLQFFYESNKHRKIEDLEVIPENGENSTGYLRYIRRSYWIQLFIAGSLILLIALLGVGAT